MYTGEGADATALAADATALAADATALAADTAALAADATALAADTAGSSAVAPMSIPAPAGSQPHDPSSPHGSESPAAIPLPSPMFNGIIVTTGRIVAIEPTPAGKRVRIDPGEWGQTPKPGGSVCVSGCCLTVVGSSSLRGETGSSSLRGETGHSDGMLSFDVIPETLAKTILGSLGVGGRVNLEPSMLASTPMDGHVVQGHVEGLGEVVKVVTEGEYRVRIAPPAGLMPCLVPKGSVTVDGVSLTIAAVETEEGWFEVALIPTTLDLTTMGELRVGSKVNLETDILARTVVHVMQHYAGLMGRG